MNEKKERGGRKEGEGGGEGEREGGRERGREKVKEGEGEKAEERKTKENITLLCCKNGQLTYHICNLILLPSSTIILFLKSIPGEAKEGRERERLKSVVHVAVNQDGLKIGLPQTVLGRERGRERGRCK